MESSYNPNLFTEAALCRFSTKLAFLKFLQNSQKKTLYLSLIFIKVAVWMAATLSKKKLWHIYFLMNFAKFLRAPPLKNTAGQLLLLLSLETTNYWVFLSFFKLYQGLFIDVLVHLAYVFVPRIEWSQSWKYILTLQVTTWFFESMCWCKRKKKWENSCEYFTLGFGKTLINCILVRSLHNLWQNKIKNLLNYFAVIQPFCTSY